MQREMAIGVLLNSALYLIGCFVIGLVLQRIVVCELAVATAGLAYLGYYAQLRHSFQPQPLIMTAALTFVAISMVLGVAAGLAIFIGG